MKTRIKTNFLFCAITALVCLNPFFLTSVAAQVTITPVASPDDLHLYL